MKTTRFPRSFVWGAATAAYQIEGAAAEDGRRPSVWDRFAKTPGKVDGGDDGDVACDHYHRWREDLALLRDLGASAYRFSIAWPRILPDGRGAVNERGLDFYERLIDHLLELGIEPFPTLYHWDLPQALEDRGGWTNRDSAAWFTDYALTVVARLGDRARRWTTFNEPNVFTILGYGTGEHAPGVRGREPMLRAVNNVNRAHARATEALRAARGGLEIGLATASTVYRPAEPTGAHDRAAFVLDNLWNRAFIDPAVLGRHTETVRAWLDGVMEPGDEDFAAPVDYLGINHYSPTYAAPDVSALMGARAVAPPANASLTDMGWAVDPGAFRQCLESTRERYGDVPVYVTENGCAYGTGPDADGRIRDDLRIDYLRGYLHAVLQAINDGCDIRGYFAWSLLDNFEWACGYSKRFGLVHVDYGDLTRRPKDSFAFYRRVIAEGDPSPSAFRI